MESQTPEEMKALANQYDRQLAEMEARERTDPGFGPDLMREVRRVMSRTALNLRAEAQAESDTN